MSATSFPVAMLLAATVVLAVGWTGAYFLRRRAAWENALWRTVLLVLLALPLAQLVGPRVFGSSRQPWNRPQEALPVVVTSGAFEGGSVEVPPMAPVKVSHQWAMGGAQWAMAWQGLLLIWGAGTVVALGRLARSAWKVRRWVRAAQPMEAEEAHRGLTDGARLAGVRPPELRVAAGLHSPVLVGWRRPCILIPSPEVAEQQEVLLHELAHLRRADLWWMTLGRVVGAGWWFHPLAWAVGRRLERSAEDVCDDLVVAWTRDAAAYARQLMRFARQAGGPRWWPLAGVAITGFRSALGKRVERVLEPGRTLRVAVGRGGVLSLAAGAALLLTLLAAASPSRGQSQVPAARPAASPQTTPPGTKVAGPGSGPAAVTPDATANKPAMSEADKAALAVINHKLSTLIVPLVEFQRTTLREGIEFLRQQAEDLDADSGSNNSGVDIVLRSPSPAEDNNKHVTIHLERVPLIEAVRQVARQAGMQVVIGPHSVSLVPAQSGSAGTAAGTVSPALSAEAIAAEKVKLAETEHKLTGIVVPDIMFHDTKISDGIAFLREEARRLDAEPDPDKRGVNLVLAIPPGDADKRVSLALNNLPLLEAVRAVVGHADLDVVVEPYTIVVQPKAK